MKLNMSRSQEKGNIGKTGRKTSIQKKEPNHMHVHISLNLSCLRVRANLVKCSEIVYSILIFRSLNVKIGKNFTS